MQSFWSDLITFCDCINCLEKILSGRVTSIVRAGYSPSPTTTPLGLGNAPENSCLNNSFLSFSFATNAR
ncbi:hypothetical protein FKM82_003057 [Ascaphus truei]